MIVEGELEPRIHLPVHDSRKILTYISVMGTSMGGSIKVSAHVSRLTSRLPPTCMDLSLDPTSPASPMHPVTQDRRLQICPAPGTCRRKCAVSGSFDLRAAEERHAQVPTAASPR